MNRLLRTTLAAVLSCWSVTVMVHAVESDGALPEPAAFEHPEVAGALAVIDAWLEATHAYEDIPGISVGIVSDQELVWARGYGHANREREVPADADTIYSVCSISKLFTSIGVMQQRDAGKLRLSDRVEKHLDWFDIERTHPGSPELSIESLLTHSSGLPRESSFGYWLGPEFSFPTRDQMIARLKSQETLYPTQHRFQYSNLAMSLLGEIFAAKAGVGFEEAISSSILEPLGMDDTRPRYPLELRGAQLAIGYSGSDRTRQRKPVEPFFTRAITPAAGFTSTVSDLARFAQWQFRLLGEDPSAEDQAVLATNTLREMQRVHWLDEDWNSSWGLGFSVDRRDGKTLVGHGGGCPGYITSFLLWPKEKIAVIALTNAGDGPAGQLASGILEVIAPALKAERKASPDEAGAADDTPDFSAYVGNYSAYPWGGEQAVRQWGDELVAIGLPRDQLGKPTRYEHLEGHTFVRIDDNGDKRETVEFEIGSDGKAERMVVHGNPSRRIR